MPNFRTHYTRKADAYHSVTYDNRIFVVTPDFDWLMSFMHMVERRMINHDMQADESANYILKRLY